MTIQIGFINKYNIYNNQKNEEKIVFRSHATADIAAYPGTDSLAASRIWCMERSGRHSRRILTAKRGRSPPRRKKALSACPKYHCLHWPAR